MNTLERLQRLNRHHETYYAYLESGRPINVEGLHQVLDILDRKIGRDTRGGVLHNPHCGPPHGQPKNYVGTRIRLHEEFIAPDYFPECCVEPKLPPLERQRISCSHWGLFEKERDHGF